MVLVLLVWTRCQTSQTHTAIHLRYLDCFWSMNIYGKFFNEQRFYLVILARCFFSLFGLGLATRKSLVRRYGIKHIEAPMEKYK